MDVKIKACCKVNIGLNIVSKREDGYHNLETVFYPVPLYDDIRLTSSDADGISIDGYALDCDPMDNLVMRSVRLLRQNGYHVPPVRVMLTKRIPSGAGLGGGSSDAAHVVKALDRALSLGIDVVKMEDMLSTLGADCPFFVRCQPVYAEGIGNVFTPIDLNLSGWHILLVKPDEHISTREAYSSVTPMSSDSYLPTLLQSPVETWRDRVKNDFEQSVFPLHPRIEEIRDYLYASGASYACMSGSGSTVFGLYQRHPAELPDAFGDCFTFVGIL